MNNIKNMKKETKTLFIIIGIVIAIAIASAIITFTTNSKNDTIDLEASKESIETELSEIQSRFEALSKEIVSDDNKTLKDGYSEEQQQLFNTILSKISDFETFITESKKNKNLGEEEYYQQFSEKVSEVQNLITVLDNDIHTNKEEFIKIYTLLGKQFEELKNALVSDDGKSLKEQYKYYQTDFDNIIQSIGALQPEADEKDQNQEFFDNLTKKGKDISSQITVLGRKTGIRLPLE